MIQMPESRLLLRFGLLFVLSLRGRIAAFLEPDSSKLAWWLVEVRLDALEWTKLSLFAILGQPVSTLDALIRLAPSSHSMSSRWRSVLQDTRRLLLLLRSWRPGVATSKGMHGEFRLRKAILTIRWPFHARPWAYVPLCTPLLKLLPLLLHIFRRLGVLVIERHLACSRRNAKRLASVLYLLSTFATKATSEILRCAQVLLFVVTPRVLAVVPLRAA